MGQKKNLHLFPSAVCLLTPVTFIITFIIAVSLNHVNPIFPYISDTGTLSPESCVFAQLLNITSLLLAFCVYIRHLQIQKQIDLKWKLKEKLKLNKVATICGYISCLGLDIVGNFQVSKFKEVHFIGAVLCFIGGSIYFILQTMFSYHLGRETSSSFLFMIRFILCTICVVLVFTTIIPAIISKKQYRGKHGKKHWEPSDGGYVWHVISAVSEWLLAFTQSSLVLTFLPEFKSVTVRSPVLKIEGELLASGDDESYIILWKQKTDHDPTEMPEEEDKVVLSDTLEQWIQVKVLRGHINDIYDLCWSPDSIHLISGSVDNCAIIWDVPKGKKVALLPEAKNFVQGVSWDPENVYVATLSSDGKCRTYAWRTHKLVAAVGKARVHSHSQTETIDAFQSSDISTDVGNIESEKPIRIFHDDTLKSFFRRLAFSPDGSLLAVPSGCLAALPDTGVTKNATWIFLRRKLGSPVLHYPSLNQPTMVTRWCPLLFKLREGVNSSVFSLPYRMVLAVATKTTVLLYDTQHAVPIAMISNIHYTKLTDLSWSSDGKFLIASSTDGYCSIITFVDGELGTIYIPPKQDGS